MKIYLDSCALNRLTDEPMQARIRTEAEAVERIFYFIRLGVLHWTASVANEFEMLQNPNEQKRMEGIGLLSFAGSLLIPDANARERTRQLAGEGYGGFDALHLACAEQAGVDVLLTTDDRFIRRAARGVGKSVVRVVNPVSWLQEKQPWLP